MLKKPLLALLALAMSPAAVTAQFPADDVVDRVLAVVGDSIVLKTQIEEEIQRMRLGQSPVPPETDPAYPEFFRSILDTWVDRVLVLQAAAKDTLIKVEDTAIEGRVSERIEQLTESLGGQSGLQTALAGEGWTLGEYRDYLRAQTKQEQIQAMFLQTRLRDARPLEISEDEMLARFQEARGQLQQRPRLLTFRQVVLVPEASEEAWSAAEQEAKALLERIRAGEDFEELARRNSDDPGSAQLGGDLGWFRRGRMVEEFEQVAFSLPTGPVSEPVKTDFGYHIIRIDRVRPGERQGRHILVIPERGEADLGRARGLAEQIATEARQGASMADLFEEYSDPIAPDSLTLTFEQVADLPPAYGVLSTASPGDVIGPLEYQAAGTETRLAIVKVEEIREAGAYTFEDVRPQIASQLQQEKQLEKILGELRQRTFIEIRM